ncbi:acetyltransferase EpsM [Salinibacillus kushneri]|uniref:Acetyltransferase EpsM n=1 Tax=Salinibacillus kushneri TaxID=237682 RepID=A0A1H9Z4W4_9BACI|nr:acetyltransferase [Salinibacillus kushneri]SES75924.1 acetyltransferase EpsM [Salinibacillus kushneri]
MKVMIVGDGGHGKVIQDIISGFHTIEIRTILDDRYSNDFFQDGKMYGPISSFDTWWHPNMKVMIAIKDNQERKRIMHKLGLSTEKYLTIIHPSSIISPTAKIGHGSVVMANAVIQADTVIGNHCIINTGAIVEHDNDVCDYTYISPNAALNGMNLLGEGVHVGASATIIVGKKLGDWSIIGAGATVIEDVPNQCTVFGTPAKITLPNNL